MSGSSNSDKAELVNEEVTYDFELSDDGESVTFEEVGEEGEDEEGEDEEGEEEEEDEDEEDLDELHGHKRLHVIKKGKERALKLLVVVENFRLGFYATFLFLIFLGVVMTTQLRDDDYGKILRDAFGVVSICVYMDFPPATYILPNLWVVALLFMEAYILCSVFRVWVVKEEEKVSQAFFVGYTLAMVYVSVSLILFTTIFAVQPDVTKPVTVKIHTAPYTNLTIAMGVLAVMVTWFGETVAWKGIDLFPGFSCINFLMVGLQISTIPVKLVHHINCLANLDEGLWWNSKTSPRTNLFLQIFDYIFLLSVVAWPTFQSAYLSYKREKTHCVYAVLMDNRKGKAAVKDSGEPYFD